MKTLHERHLEKECQCFAEEIKLIYEECIKCLEKWLNPFKEFHCFCLMCLDARKDTSFDKLLPCRLHLTENGITADDIQLVDF